MTAILNNVEVLLFDVFGTTVDWRRSVERELASLVAQYGLGGSSWVQLPDSTWGGDLVQPGFSRILVSRAIAAGAPGTTNVDVMHRQILDNMLDAPNSRWKFLADVLGEKEREQLNNVWHRLEGLHALKKHVICGGLSNGNIRLLVDMAKHASLPWDVIFSTELFDTFKPNPNAYISALHHLSIEPSRCAMVAAHMWDLRGARSVGMRTIYVPRLGEESREEVKTIADGGEVDMIVESFEQLADIVAATSN
ncbi:hypothetical protein H0H92_003231 [Tricholoma furcatifolium]|nr:hypothetical protein H0H92_003231 [Tricholoma furcatifolium]